MMPLYYAHPMSMYATKRERADISFLHSGGHDVLNPSDKWVEDLYLYSTELLPTPNNPMPFFIGLAASCRACAFRCFPEQPSWVGAGVHVEVLSFYANRRPVNRVFEGPDGRTRIEPISKEIYMGGRFKHCTVEETREMIRLHGDKGWRERRDAGNWR